MNINWVETPALAIVKKQSGNHFNIHSKNLSTSRKILKQAGKERNKKSNMDIENDHLKFQHLAGRNIVQYPPLYTRTGE